MRQRHWALAGAILSLCASDVLTQTAEAVDLRRWTRCEYPGTQDYGDWRVATEGSSVTQRKNVDSPSFFVSDFQLSEGIFEGTLQQGTDGDDDYFGFVFAFQGLDVGFYLFQWKRGNQPVDYGLGSVMGEAGWSVLRVVGRDTLKVMETRLWDAETGGPVTLLASDKGVGKGWAEGRAYNFRLELEPGRARIAVSGASTAIETEILDDTFIGGRVGFYNLSQSLVTYRGFTTLRPSFLRGDANADGTVDVSDAIAALSYLFHGLSGPECTSVLDVDDSETLNLNDPIFALNCLFGIGGLVIPAPFPDCGWDPTPGPLTCPGHPPCQ